MHADPREHGTDLCQSGGSARSGPAWEESEPIWLGVSDGSSNTVQSTVVDGPVRWTAGQAGVVGCAKVRRLCRTAAGSLDRLEEHCSSTRLTPWRVARSDLDVGGSPAGDAVNAKFHLDWPSRWHDLIRPGIVALGSGRTARPGAGIAAQRAGGLGPSALWAGATNVFLRALVATRGTCVGNGHKPFSCASGGGYACRPSPSCASSPLRADCVI